MEYFLVIEKHHFLHCPLTFLGEILAARSSSEAPGHPAGASRASRTEAAALPNALPLCSLRAGTVSRMAKHIPQGSWASLSHLIGDLGESTGQGLLLLLFHPTEMVSTKTTQWGCSTLSKDAALVRGDPVLSSALCKHLDTYPALKV